MPSWDTAAYSVLSAIFAVLFAKGLDLMFSGRPVWGWVLGVVGLVGLSLTIPWTRDLVTTKLLGLYAHFGVPHPTASLIVISLAGAAIGGFLFGGSWWLLSAHQEPVVTEQPQGRSEPPPVLAAPPKPITLVASYESAPPPVTIAPHSTLYLLPLHPQIIQWLQQFGNSGDSPLSWPSQVELDSAKGLPDIPWRCDIQNLGDVPVLNVAMTFKVKFNEAKPAPNQPPGQTGQIAGQPLSSHEHQISIGVLDGKAKFSFYIVNQSKDFAYVDFPTTASLQLPGENFRRRVNLVRQSTSILN